MTSADLQQPTYDQIAKSQGRTLVLQSKDSALAKAFSNSVTTLDMKRRNSQEDSISYSKDKTER